MTLKLKYSVCMYLERFYFGIFSNSQFNINYIVSTILIHSSVPSKVYWSSLYVLVISDNQSYSWQDNFVGCNWKCWRSAVDWYQLQPKIIASLATYTIFFSNDIALTDDAFWRCQILAACYIAVGASHFEDRFCASWKGVTGGRWMGAPLWLTVHGGSCSCL